MTTINKKSFGFINGDEIYLYTLDNGNTQVDIMSLGASIVSIRTPDINGKIFDVVLGYDSAEEYPQKNAFLGCIVGRNSNRVEFAKFELNGKTYNLLETGKNINIHGAPQGFDSKIWDCQDINGDLVCKITSPDGESGFPGNADVKVTYSLSSDNELILDYHAICDEDTIMNLTNHVYFNLNGHESGDVLGHEMQIFSDFYTPLNDNFCPSGEIISLRNTAYDFSSAKKIGKDIENIPDYDSAKGYDHNYILRSKEKNVILAVKTIGEKSGIIMETYTNKPAVQFYSGNSLTGYQGKENAIYKKWTGFCLETQLTPNCMNIPHLGDAVLRKGEIYNDRTIYKFSCK